MNLDKLKKELLSLSEENREELLSVLSKKSENSLSSQRVSRRELLNNKQGFCPHCLHGKYVRFGIDAGAQRYKCKSCMRSFTEYTGTWMAGLHSRDKVCDF